MAKTTKVVFVGAGGIAGNHMDGLAKIPGVEIAGVFDVDAARARSRAGQCGAATFGSVARMINATKPDAAFICVPPFAHGKPEMACVRKRVPFFVEKPISQSLTQARRIARAVRDAKLMTCAGYMNRYRRSVNRAKELLAKNPPAIIYGGWFGRPATKHPWLPVKALSGGQLVEQTTHTVDLLRYLCGEAKSVYARGITGYVKRAPRFTAENASSAVIEMANGAVANIMSSWASNLDGGVMLKIYSTDLLVEFSSWNHDVVIHKSDIEEERIAGETNIFEIEDRAFVDALRAGSRKPIACDYADAVRSLEISIAAGKSMQTGRPVKITA